jgi:hypothetical protein
MNHFWAAASVALALDVSAAAAQSANSSRTRQDSSLTVRVLTPHAEAHESEHGVIPAPFDATMTLIGAAEDLPEAVTKNIDLPRDGSGAYLASPRGASRAAHGLTNANLARANGRAFGLATAENAREEARAASRAAVGEAREASRAFAQAAAAAAEQSREDVVHASEPALGVLPGDRGGAVVPVRAFLPAASGRP